MDLPDIAIVIQWRATPSISALWQRFGRCVRDPTLEGTAIFFAEKEYFDVLANEKKKRKRNSSSIKIEPGTSSTAKQTKLGPSTSRSAASRDHEASDEEGEEEGEEEEEAEEEEKDDSDDAEDEKDDEKGKGKKKKPSTYSRKKSKKEKIEPAVFTLLNADTRGVSCRRQPFSDQFENTKAVSLHLECDPSMLNGCDRCRPAVIETCCDIHNPELASLYKATVIKTPRQVGRSRLPLKKEMSAEDKEHQQEKDQALRMDLEKWRRDMTAKKYSRGHLRNLGAGLVMGTTTRDRIVECARYGKIRTIANLDRETKWTGANEFGNDILRMIETHYPIDPPPIISIEQITEASSNAGYSHELPFTQNVGHSDSALRAKRQVKCSVCHLEGHTSSFTDCPL
ncbi:hypothetical protein F5887DRAFT_1135447 [Amanita rubescens]|nr:hypothetical protein F5887DRAFT_1135447 [Amanita rubescens]